jgi:hypothetical protein
MEHAQINKRLKKKSPYAMLFTAMKKHAKQYTFLFEEFVRFLNFMRLQ